MGEETTSSPSSASHRLVLGLLGASVLLPIILNAVGPPSTGVGERLFFLILAGASLPFLGCIIPALLVWRGNNYPKLTAGFMTAVWLVAVGMLTFLMVVSYGGVGPGDMMKACGTRNIFRNNIIVGGRIDPADGDLRRGGGVISTTVFNTAHSSVDAQELHLYNNVLGLSQTNSVLDVNMNGDLYVENMTANVYVNNVILRGQFDSYALRVPEVYGVGDDQFPPIETFRFEGNLVVGSEELSGFISEVERNEALDYADWAAGLPAATSDAFVFDTDDVWNNDHPNAVSGMPIFLDVTENDFQSTFALYSNSSQDSVPLTNVSVDATATTVIVVDDAHYFVDGFGLVTGDALRIGGNSSPFVVVSKINSTALELDGPVTVSAGDPVWLWGLERAGVSDAFAPDFSSEFDLGTDLASVRPVNITIYASEDGSGDLPGSIDDPVNWNGLVSEPIPAGAVIGVVGAIRDVVALDLSLGSEVEPIWFVPAGDTWSEGEGVFHHGIQVDKGGHATFWALQFVAHDGQKWFHSSEETSHLTLLHCVFDDVSGTNEANGVQLYGSYHVARYNSIEDWYGTDAFVLHGDHILVEYNSFFGVSPHSVLNMEGSYSVARFNSIRDLSDRCGEMFSKEQQNTYSHDNVFEHNICYRSGYNPEIEDDVSYVVAIYAASSSVYVSAIIVSVVVGWTVWSVWRTERE